MDTIPVELYEIIFGFLSSKDRVTLREVNHKYESLINKKNLTVCKLENKIKRIHSIEKKMSRDLILTINSNFLLYTDCNENNNSGGGVHKLFRVNNYHHDRCINEQCREKRLGNIYFSKKLPPQNYHQSHTSTLFERYWNFYTKRKIPYCIYCFNKWGVFASSNYGVN